MENLGGEKEKIEISKDENLSTKETEIKEENIEGNWAQKQRRAQEEISNRYHKVEGMFGSGEMVVKGIMQVIDHGVENTSGRF